MIYLEILNLEYEIRKEKNSLYSKRAFARDAGISASTLSEILSRKKGISDKKALEISRNLGFDDELETIFLNSVLYTFSKNKEKKKQAFEVIAKYNKDFKLKRIKKLAKSETLSSWEACAVLVWLGIANNKKNKLKAIEELNISPEKLGSVLKNLESLDMIELQGDREVITKADVMEQHVGSHTSRDEAKKWARSLHQGVLDLAIKKMYLHSQGIHFHSSFMSMDPERFKELVNEYKKLEKEIRAKYEDCSEKGRIHQFSFQAFPVQKL